jgi:hypothetical protein
MLVMDDTYLPGKAVEVWGFYFGFGGGWVTYVEGN